VALKIIFLAFENGKYKIYNKILDIPSKLIYYVVPRENIKGDLPEYVDKLPSYVAFATKV
jgi:hypothetical protein